MCAKYLSCRFIMSAGLLLLFLVLFDSSLEAQDEKQTLSYRRDLSRIGFHIELNAGPAWLQSEYDVPFGDSKRTQWMVYPQFNLSFGLRFRSIYYVSWYIDGEVGYGRAEGNFQDEDINVFDPYTSQSSIIESVPLTTILAGVHGGMSIPLYRSRRIEMPFFSPRVIALKINFGFYALIINEGSISYEFDNYYVSYEDERIGGDWGLFTAGTGIILYFSRYMGFHVTFNAGIFPISTVVQSSDPDEIGKTSYGYLHCIITGIQFRI